MGLGVGARVRLRVWARVRARSAARALPSGQRKGLLYPRPAAMVSIGSVQRKSPESNKSLPSRGCTASRASAAPSGLRRAPSSSASAPSVRSEVRARAT